MKVLLQRVTQAKVEVAQKVTGQIDQGLLLFVGFADGDTAEQVAALAKKVVHLRVFADEAQKMNLSLLDIGGSVLSISQFTLYGDCRKGRRPNFTQAAKPDKAQELYEAFNQQLGMYGVEVATGIFGADMQVSLNNDGPVTFLLES